MKTTLSSEKEVNVLHFYRRMKLRDQSFSLPQLLNLQLLLPLLPSCSSRVCLCATPQTQPTRLPRPWDSPGKNTGVGCHFLLQCMKVKSESEVTQLCPTPSDSMDCSPPGSSVHGIFQARVLEWDAIASITSSYQLSKITEQKPFLNVLPLSLECILK